MSEWNIAKFEKELNELSQLEKKAVPESSILSEYLELLVSRKIKRISIVLEKASHFVLEIKRQRHGLILQIRNLKKLRRNYAIDEEELFHLSHLGFMMDRNETRLKLILGNRGKEELLEDLKKVIVKIVFEIYYFKQFEGASFIEIEY